jgi:hypothetical protein
MPALPGNMLADTHLLQLQHLQNKVMCVTGKFLAPSALQIACAFQESVYVIILLQNCAGNKLKSYEIMRIKMLAALDKTKPSTGYYKRVKLGSCQACICQVTKLPLQ